MKSSKQRGSRVISVALSARQFPDEVREWLARLEPGAAASHDLYDALAMLVRGRRPAALIVAIESVDWDELEFFEQVRRVARDTRVFVAGPPHQAEKLKAALAADAQLFNPDAADEFLASLEVVTAAPPGLLAGSLQQEVPVHPEVAAAEPEPPAVEERPPVRLVTSAEAEESDAPVPFPWAPSSKRPQRTPPKPARESAQGTGRTPPHPTLTSEELAALLGQPFTRDPGQSQESGS